MPAARFPPLALAICCSASWCSRIPSTVTALRNPLLSLIGLAAAGAAPAPSTRATRPTTDTRRAGPALLTSSRLVIRRDMSTFPLLPPQSARRELYVPDASAERRMMGVSSGGRGKATLAQLRQARPHVLIQWRVARRGRPVMPGATRQDVACAA